MKHVVISASILRTDPLSYDNWPITYTDNILQTNKVRKSYCIQEYMLIAYNRLSTE